MAGDKKGKGKQVVQQRKKHTREDHERERAQAVADAAGRQGSLQGRLEVVPLTGQQAVTVTERQLVRTVMQRRSLHRLSCLIFGAFQDLGSRG